MAWVVKRITEAFDCNSRVLLLASFPRFSCLSYHIHTRHSLSSSSPFDFASDPGRWVLCSTRFGRRLARYISEGSGLQLSLRSVRSVLFREDPRVVFPFLFGPTSEVSVCRPLFGSFCLLPVSVFSDTYFPRASLS